jgi:hypothetical protein
MTKSMMPLLKGSGSSKSTELVEVVAAKEHEASRAPKGRVSHDAEGQPQP